MPIPAQPYMLDNEQTTHHTIHDSQLPGPSDITLTPLQHLRKKPTNYFPK